jgi:hypothetical protein
MYPLRRSHRGRMKQVHFGASTLLISSRKPAPCPEQTGYHSKGEAEGQSNPGLHQAPCCCQIWFLLSNMRLGKCEVNIGRLREKWSIVSRFPGRTAVRFERPFLFQFGTGVARCLQCLQAPTQLFFSSAWNSSTSTKQRFVAIYNIITYIYIYNIVFPKYCNSQ